MEQKAITQPEETQRRTPKFQTGADDTSRDAGDGDGHAVPFDGSSSDERCSFGLAWSVASTVCNVAMLEREDGVPSDCAATAASSQIFFASDAAKTDGQQHAIEPMERTVKAIKCALAPNKRCGDRQFATDDIDDGIQRPEAATRATCHPPAAPPLPPPHRPHPGLLRLAATAERCKRATALLLAHSSDQ